MTIASATSRRVRYCRQAECASASGGGMLMIAEPSPEPTMTGADRVFYRPSATGRQAEWPARRRARPPAGSGQDRLLHRLTLPCGGAGKTAEGGGVAQRRAEPRQDEQRRLERVGLPQRHVRADG